ncbi:MAG: hypothetical protein H8E76_00850 [Helicobacteraceae bacterium]|nr:hypothetical protein [Candidatus Sulfurimonas ponti]MBL6972854.1 hypothetical protein [Sulfurimonas sp.]
MELTTTSDTLSISGNIKSINDFQDIKNRLDSMKTTTKNIVIIIKDSISVTSSVIGYFNKLILKDKITLRMKIGNAELIELLDDLHLIETFNVSKL